MSKKIALYASIAAAVATSIALYHHYYVKTDKKKKKADRILTLPLIDFNKFFNREKDPEAYRRECLNVAEALSSHLDIKVPIKISGNYRIGDIRHNVADLKKAKKIFDFEPQFFFEDGLAKFVKWVKNEEIQIDSYENSLKELKLKGLLK